jgi:hypothetical protein
MSIVLASPKLSDVGTLTASSQVATFEAANLQRMSPGKKHRSTTLSFYYEGNLGGAKTIRVVSLWGANAVAATTWRVRFATSQANLTAAPSWDSESISFWPGGADLSGWAESASREYYAAGKTATWYRIDIDHSASGALYWEVARLIVAGNEACVDFSTFGDRGRAVGPLEVRDEEPVVEMVDQGGEEIPRPRRSRRSLGPLPFTQATDAQVLGQLRPFFRNRGSSKDWLFITKPTETVYPLDYMLLGRSKGVKLWKNTYADHWDGELGVTEV